MPLPDDPTTVTGGCSCGAVRYRIVIPRLEDLPTDPMASPEASSLRPHSTACHCNDCRRATASLLAGRAGLECNIYMLPVRNSSLSVTGSAGSVSRPGLFKRRGERTNKKENTTQIYRQVTDTIGIITSGDTLRLSCTLIDVEGRNFGNREAKRRKAKAKA
ncbi:hypothetical protein ACJZ2D_016727 [Fusarium nematophilum]